MNAPDPQSDPFAKLRLVSKVMVFAVTFGMGAVVALVAVVFFVPAVTRATFEYMPYGLTEVSVRARLIAFAVFCIPLAIFLVGLNEVRRLFVQYADGDVLSLSAARRLKRIAWITIIGAVMRPPTRVGLFYSFAIDQAETARPPAFLVTADFIFLLSGLLLLAVAWAMTEAARIAEEHRQII